MNTLSLSTSISSSTLLCCVMLGVLIVLPCYPLQGVSDSESNLDSKLLSRISLYRVKKSQRIWRSGYLLCWSLLRIHIHNTLLTLPSMLISGCCKILLLETFIWLLFSNFMLADKFSIKQPQWTRHWSVLSNPDAVQRLVKRITFYARWVC